MSHCIIVDRCELYYLNKNVSGDCLKKFDFKLFVTMNSKGSNIPPWEHPEAVKICKYE